ncbi:hypothetical protein [Streptomyces sp. NPDC058735]|uniref:hypothetical protein n=1 Tax=unclassified Streptomyces TaxID=2593676 RepID=UPI0036C87505
MTAHRPNTPPPALAEEVARTVEAVAGVAFLKPGLAGRLRSALSRPAGQHPARERPSGVRLTGPDDGGSWHIEIDVVVDRRARALDVARAVRGAVGTLLAALVPDRPAPRLTVTVTGRV